MSQTNAFAKLQNSDYVYMDLQQTNVYNNTTDNEIDINFIETRNAPIIKNTGEYDLSVTRFQIDSYKLPSLVIEPDLDSVPFEPNKTIHKVAIMTSNSTIVSTIDPPYEMTENLLQGSNISNDKYGSSISYSNDLNRLIIGAPNSTVSTFSNAGKIYYQSITTPYTATPIAVTLPGYITNYTNSYLGQAVAVKKSGEFLVAIRLIPNPPFNIEILTWQAFLGSYTLVFQSFPYIFNSLPNCSIAISNSGFPIGGLLVNELVAVGFPEVLSSSYGVIITNTDGSVYKQYQAISGRRLGASIAISGDGTIVVAGAPSNSVGPGLIRIYKWNATTEEYNVVNDWASASVDNFGFSVAISEDGLIIAGGSPYTPSDAGYVNIYKWNGSSYNFQQTLTYDIKFGNSISLNSNGTVLTVGTGGTTIPIPPFATTNLAIINNPTGLAEYFGSALGYSNSTNTLVIGALFTSVAGDGAVYIYNVATSTLSAPLTGQPPTPTGGNYLGQSVDISEDGLRVVAMRGQTPLATTLNLAIWQLVGSSYVYQRVYTLSSIASASNIGNTVAISNLVSIGTYTYIIVVGVPSVAGGGVIRMLGYNDTLTTEISTISQTGHTLGDAVAISLNGLIVVAGAPPVTGTKGKVFVYKLVGGVFIEIFQYTPTGTPLNDNLGASVALSDDLSVVVAGSPNFNSSDGRVDIFIVSGSTYAFQQSLSAPVAGIKFGTSVAINNNGTVLTIGTIGNTEVYTYTRTSNSVLFSSNTFYTISTSISAANALVANSAGTEFFAGSYNDNRVIRQSQISPTPAGGSANDAYTYLRDNTSVLFTTYTYYKQSTNILTAKNVVMNSTGSQFLMSDPNATATLGNVVLERLVSGSVPVPIPTNIVNIASVANVIWEPSTIYPIPQVVSLTGKNTVTFPYYYCNSYDYFINLVNKALVQASASNYNYLWTQWMSTLSNSSKGVFLDAAYKSFPTAPFLDWETKSLKSNLFVNQCYNYYPNGDYAVPPITWATSTGTVEVLPPFTFKVAMNPSLYALFNSFPATKTLLTTTTGTTETFYVLTIASTGHPMTLPSPTINKTLYSSYIFNTLIYSTSTFLYTLSPTTTTTYSYINQFIKLSQELSTIDTWTPINAIVFTTGSIPITANQFSANTTINAERLSAETGAEFALIITDLQTNKQGYKPNVLYNPTGEYRRLAMTGNRDLTCIDIRVFWRAKTGQLIPFKLSSGVSSSIKLLFQKKLLAEKQKLGLKALSSKMGSVPSAL